MKDQKVAQVGMMRNGGTRQSSGPECQQSPHCATMLSIMPFGICTALCVNNRNYGDMSRVTPPNEQDPS